MRAQQGRSDDTGVTAVLIELTATCFREGGKWENLHADGSPEISLSSAISIQSPPSGHRDAVPRRQRLCRQPRTDALQAALAVMGLAMEGTLIMPVLLIVIVAVIILIAIMRSASKSKGMLARQCPYCKNDINGKATVCDYCHRDVTGISS